MKRYLLIVALTLFICSGCVKVTNASLDTLIQETVSSKYKLFNHVNSGYKYYLPRTLKSTVTDEFNEIIKSKYKDLNEVVTNSLVILSSVTYIDDVIASNLNKNEFASAEEQVNIFDNASVDTNYLDEVDDTYTGNEDDYDPDVIKERG